MKTGFLHLLLLCLLFTSCYENEVYLPEYEGLAQESILTSNELAGESSIVISNILADMLKAISLSPELNLTSENPVAQVRSSCPTSYLLSDGIFPDTFFVDFNNCDPSAVFDQTYDGSVMFILNGELDDPNVCPLFSIKKSPTNQEFLLQLGNSDKAYNVNISNKVDFCLQSNDGSRLKYNYTLDGGINLDVGRPSTRISGNGISTILNVSGTTCYPSGMEGCITLKSNNKDNTTKPDTFIDNTYCVSAKPTIIECKWPDGRVEPICIATNPEGISYNLRCGCPQSGKLYIESPANGDCNDILNTDSFWDYGFVQNPNVGSCENSALDPDNIVTRIPCGQSF